MTQTDPIEELTPDQLAEVMERHEVVLIDVRTPQEYALERIPGALLMPMQEFDAAALPTQDGKRVVFHCGSGVRSAKMAQKYLDQHGGTVAHLGGGMGAWKKAGQPYVGTDMPTGAPKRMRTSD